MTDNQTTKLLRDYAFALRRLEYDADKPGSNMTLGEYEAEEKKVTDRYAYAIAATLGSGKLTAEQVEEAVYRNCKFYEGGEVDIESITDELNATLGGDDKLLNLAHQAWSIAICAMQNMPIPAKWGNAVESGLREYGIDIDLLPFVMTESGTCENIAPDYLDFLCSKCGFVHYHSDENDTGDGNDWNYCPNCRAKVIK